MGGGKTFADEEDTIFRCEWGTAVLLRPVGVGFCLGFVGGEGEGRLGGTAGPGEAASARGPLCHFLGPEAGFGGVFGLGHDGM